MRRGVGVIRSLVKFGWSGVGAAGLAAAVLVYAWHAEAENAAHALGRMGDTQTEIARVFIPLMVSAAASRAAAENAARPWTRVAGNQTETVDFGDSGRPAVKVIRGPPQSAAKPTAAKPQDEAVPSQFKTLGSDDLSIPPVAILRGARETSAKLQEGAVPDPRPPTVHAVHGGNRAAAPVPTPTLFSASTANTELINFGGAAAATVAVVRGAGPPPAPRASPPAPVFAGGRIETVRFGGPGLPQVDIIRGSSRSFGRETAVELFGAANTGELNRVAFAVDGAESGHGANLAMWRPELDGPQGPMQVSAAAALDVGGGDRFDLRQNRLLGRAFLARLYARYGNWPDAIAAYNWGPGNLDGWIAAGRPVDLLPLETARYLTRVLRDAFLVRPS